ncbi:hypothetical protein GH733_019368 [Mirounga leonina]|nr:hypothetical protein GH733_019368 [Mirounga leonina]
MMWMPPNKRAQGTPPGHGGPEAEAPWWEVDEEEEKENRNFARPQAANRPPEAKGLFLAHHPGSAALYLLLVGCRTTVLLGGNQGSAGCQGGRLWPGAVHTSPGALLEVGTSGETRGAGAGLAGLRAAAGGARGPPEVDGGAGAGVAARGSRGSARTGRRQGRPAQVPGVPAGSHVAPAPKETHRGCAGLRAGSEAADVGAQRGWLTLRPGRGGTATRGTHGAPAGERGTLGATRGGQRAAAAQPAPGTSDGPAFARVPRGGSQAPERERLLWGSRGVGAPQAASLEKFQRSLSVLSQRLEPDD